MTGKQLPQNRKVERGQRIRDLVERDGLSFAIIGDRLGMHQNQARDLYHKAVKLLER